MARCRPGGTSAHNRAVMRAKRAAWADLARMLESPAARVAASEVSVDTVGVDKAATVPPLLARLRRAYADHCPLPAPAKPAAKAPKAPKVTDAVVEGVLGQHAVAEAPTWTIGLATALALFQLFLC